MVGVRVTDAVSEDSNAAGEASSSETTNPGVGEPTGLDLDGFSSRLAQLRHGSGPPPQAGPPPAPAPPPPPRPRRRAAWAALAVAGILLMAGVAGALFWAWSGADADPGDYVEVFLTDQPAGMTALELRLAGVYAGQGNHSLRVEVPVFDLLQLQGPGQALRVAAGFVPDGDHGVLRIVFHSAHATFHGERIELPIPEAMLVVEHGRSLSNPTSSAILLDVGVAESVVLTDQGFVFRPHVVKVYAHEYADRPQRASDGGPDSAFTQHHRPDFAADPAPHEPARQSNEHPSVNMQPRSPPQEPGGGGGSGSGSSGNGGSVGEPDDAANNTAPDFGDTLSDTGLVLNDTLDMVDREVGMIIQFARSHAASVHEAMVALGYPILHGFPSGEAGYVLAPVSALGAISEIPGIVYIEPEKPVQFTLDSSTTAIRAQWVDSLLTTLYDAQGQPIDGRGIGVAVIDTGIDALHPDLPYATGLHPDPVVVRNYKFASLSYQVDLVPLPNTDTTSGHGTHVAGIIAGQGMQDPNLRGVAPGAKLYGFGIGEASTTLWTNQALDWVLQNHDTVDPPIRVVTNSWSTGTQHDPNAYSTRLVNDLVAAGVVVVFAAGNRGGDGSSIRTSAEGQNPTEGVIMVAAYNDYDDGRRDGTIHTTSSRGQVTVPASWPDISAPGVRIESTVPSVSLAGLGLFYGYREMTGTSQAAPHVAAVVALMLQANPDLTPAQVERLIESSAHKFTDGGAYAQSNDLRYRGSHWAKGHGLLDARAAVEAALGA